MQHEIPAPGPQTILAGKGFIASVNRVAEFIRQWQRPSLGARRRTNGVIYSLHTDPAAAQIDLTIDDLEAVLRRAMPANYPDREELARELFLKDNSKGRPEHLLNDWIDLSAHGETYAHRLADAAIEQFRKVNR